MPSPSVNKAVDIVMKAFPGSEILTDTTRPIPKPDKQMVDDGWGERVRTTKPPPENTRRRFKKGTKKPGKNQEGMFMDDDG